MKALIIGAIYLLTFSETTFAACKVPVGADPKYIWLCPIYRHDPKSCFSASNGQCVYEIECFVKRGFEKTMSNGRCMELFNLGGRRFKETLDCLCK